MPDETATERSIDPNNMEQKSNENKEDETEHKKQDNSKFECNICLEFASDPVVSMCGHLFCWPCLHQWLITRPNQQSCPVCKASINRDNVIPLYGRSGNETDPRSKELPPRPRAVRNEESTNNSGWQFSDPHGNVQFSLGIGIFPISFIASIFNSTTTTFVGDQANTNIHESQQQVEERMLSHIFCAMSLLFMLWLFLT